MPVIISIKNRGTGPFLTVSGKKAGAFKFVRTPGNHSEHRLVLTPDEFNAKSRELLTTPGNPPMDIEVVPEIAPEDAALKEAILVAQKTAADAEAKVAELTQLIEQTKHELGEAQKGNGTGGLSDDYLDMLKERDELLAVLQPLAKEGETPLECLARFFSMIPAGHPPAVLEPHEQNLPAVPNIDPLTLPYEDMLKFAKETLGLVYKTKPGKAKLLEDVAANLNPATE